MGHNAYNNQLSTCRKQQCSDEFLRFCQRMLTDLQSRIRKSRERLALTQNPDALPPTATEQQREAHELMNKLTDRIAQLVDEAEAAGCSGEVEEVGYMICDYLGFQDTHQYSPTRLMDHWMTA